MQGLVSSLQMEKIQMRNSLSQINASAKKMNMLISKKRWTIRRCSPQCIAHIVIADPKDKDAKILQTITYCLTCLVHKHKALLSKDPISCKTFHISHLTSEAVNRSNMKRMSAKKDTSKYLSFANII